MEIKITSIADRGNLVHERIGFNVLKNCQLEFYIVFKTRKTANGFYNRSKYSYWFLPENLKINDKIVLYTKKGDNAIKQNPDGSSTYFFYWGLDDALFKEDKDRIVLINAKSYILDKALF